MNSPNATRDFGGPFILDTCTATKNAFEFSGHTLVDDETSDVKFVFTLDLGIADSEGMHIFTAIVPTQDKNTDFQAIRSMLSSVKVLH